jgi:hypothetical protein
MSDRSRRTAPGAKAPADKSLPAGSDRHPLLELQRQAGNRAVTALVGGQAPAQNTAQRVAVTAPTQEETLFNNRGGGQASARVYGGSGGATFDMSRGGTPEVVTTTVRIRFVQQNRVLSAPDANGNQFPTDQGTESVIPPGDARRAFAQNICDTAPTHWNNRAVLAGTRSAPGMIVSLWNSDTGGPVRLPLRFRAVPVWDLAPVPADTEIRVFPQAQQAGGPIHPIDAGHYYMNKGPNYSGNDEAIYAHEYGHLLGLNDEYSQSNPQMHAVLHGMDPATATERGNVMDREAVRRMVLAALTRPLHDRVSAATNEIAGAFTAGSAPVVGALAGSLHTALADPGVKTMLAANMPPALAALTPSIAGYVNAAVHSYANTNAVASSVVASEFSGAQLGALVKRLYFEALSAAAQGAVDVGGVNMKVNIEGNAGINATGNAVAAPLGLWGGGGAPAADIAATVDQAAGKVRTGRVPPVRPSGSILRELSTLPAGWDAFRAAAPAALASGTLTSDLNTALLSAWLANLTSSAPAPAAIAGRRALWRAVNNSVHAASQAAAINGVRAFLQSELQPVMHTSTTSLMTAIGDEVTRVMGTPANQLALTSPRDPAIASLVSNMRSTMLAQAAAATAAQTAAGSTALDPGTTAPAQQVTYSTVNMMSSNDDIFRQDQFTALAALFNSESSLKHAREGSFHVEMGAT